MIDAALPPVDTVGGILKIGRNAHVAGFLDKRISLIWNATENKRIPLQDGPSGATMLHLS